MLPTANFHDNILYRIILYSYWFLLTNVFTFIFCLPLLILLQFKMDYSNLFYWVLLFLAVLPIGPALSASFSMMGKVVRVQQLSFLKDVVTSLKQNFSQSLLVWSIQVIISAILVADLVMISNTKLGSYLYPLLFLLMIFNILMGLYLYPLISRFVMTTKSVLKLSFGLIFSKYKLTILLFSLITLTGMILYWFPFISLFFIFGPFCFIVMLILKGLLNNLENTITKSQK